MIVATAISLSVILVTAIFLPVVSVDNYLYYGKVSVTCYYIGFGGLSVQPHQAGHPSPGNGGIPSFTYDCPYYVTGYYHTGST